MRLGNVMDGRGTFPLAFHLIAMYYVQWWLQKCSEEIKKQAIKPNRRLPRWRSLPVINHPFVLQKTHISSLVLW